ncbi:LysE family translocator [Alteribacillus iranensis]|uniref:Threonine/homoserine/homoserine lactone efflux protein n=1 Tax=Alteribacillus iranensis TaxID=930128 RepID=A0A1I2DQ67_9BACI|nr:LysE family translocator [Alteribacillus iranensis]SFE82676.1 Threonine/homoserine/homoserine lactone efflux protein [Alteribacillus iranensis]
MDIVIVLAFIGTAVALTLAPGPDILFVIVQSIAQDKKAGIATALGLCSGLLVHITAAAIGISALIYQSSLAFSIVKYAGAAYLLYLAWQAFRSREKAALDADAQPSMQYQALYRKGIVMNLLNPKVSLFFLALLPQFTHEGAVPVSIQMIIFGLLFLLQAFVIFSLVSILASKTGRFIFNNPMISRRMNIIQGSLFTVIGLQILFSNK